MSLETLSEAAVTFLYENIRAQAEADRPHQHRLTAAPLIRQRAEELRSEMVKRRLPYLPIDW
jgi:hypothetical protein